MTKIIGVNFCHENKIKQLVQFIPSTTSGNQKWNGAIPIFIKRAELKLNIIEFSMFFIKKKFFDSKIIEIRRIKEAKACDKKYFNELSEDKELFFC